MKVRCFSKNGLIGRQQVDCAAGDVLVRLEAPRIESRRGLQDAEGNERDGEQSTDHDEHPTQTGPRQATGASNARGSISRMKALFGPDDVARVAALAHLALLTPEEGNTVHAAELAEILEYATEIQAVDTSGVPPTAYALAHETAVRPDEPQASLTREAALANAPSAAREAGLFRVPKVIG